jgi:hypothetical protein
MYALIYDEHDPTRPLKKVISVHRSRETAERALADRMKRLDRPVWECNTRIVWVKGQVKANDILPPSAYRNWRPGEKIPWGETHSDTD